MPAKLANQLQPAEPAQRRAERRHKTLRPPSLPDLVAYSFSGLVPLAIRATVGLCIAESVWSEVPVTGVSIPVPAVVPVLDLAPYRRAARVGFQPRRIVSRMVSYVLPSSRAAAIAGAKTSS